MDTESTQASQRHDIAIAVMQKDVEYIKKGMENMMLTLASMDRDFARRSELSAITDTLKKINDALEKKASHEDIAEFKRIFDSKVDKSEFAPIQKTLNKINWILISSVVVGLLALLIKGSN